MNDIPSTPQDRNATGTSPADQLGVAKPPTGGNPLIPVAQKAWDRRTIDDLQKSKDALETQVGVLKKENMTLLDQLEDTNRIKNEAIDNFKEANKILEQETMDLKDHVKSLEKQNGELIVRNTRLKVRNQELKEKNTSLDNELLHERGKVEDLNRQNGELVDRNARLRGQLDPSIIESEVKVLRADNENLKQRVAELENEVKDLNDKLSSTRQKASYQLEHTTRLENIINNIIQDLGPEVHVKLDYGFASVPDLDVVPSAVKHAVHERDEYRQAIGFIRDSLARLGTFNPNGTLKQLAASVVSYIFTRSRSDHGLQVAVENLKKAVKNLQKANENLEHQLRKYVSDRDYYQGLVIRCGKAIGNEAFTSDDGKTHTGVLCAKVPELVEKLVSRVKELEAGGKSSFISLPRNKELNEGEQANDVVFENSPNLVKFRRVFKNGRFWLMIDTPEQRPDRFLPGSTMIHVLCEGDTKWKSDLITRVVDARWDYGSIIGFSLVDGKLVEGTFMECDHMTLYKKGVTHND